MIANIQNHLTQKITLDELIRNLELNPQDISVRTKIVNELRSFEKKGFGRFIIGRRGYQSRWEPQQKEHETFFVKKAKGIIPLKETIIEEKFPVENDYKTEVKMEHGILIVPLRENLMVRLAIPLDITREEKEKIARAILKCNMDRVSDGKRSVYLSEEKIMK